LCTTAGQERQGHGWVGHSAPPRLCRRRRRFRENPRRHGGQKEVSVLAGGAGASGKNSSAGKCGEGGGAKRPGARGGVGAGGGRGGSGPPPPAVCPSPLPGRGAPPAAAQPCPPLPPLARQNPAQPRRPRSTVGWRSFVIGHTMTVDGGYVGPISRGWSCPAH